MTTPKAVWTPCDSCDRATKHDVLFSAEESETDYPMDSSFQVVKCRGCESHSFRKVISYLAEAQQIDDDEWEVPKDVFSYPPTLNGHRAVPDVARAPRIVRDIYRESLDAIKNQSFTLAGIGLRATIEAICNERSVTGRNLEIRIDKLAKSGFVSQADADRLHAIRFMGNDAAHEIHAGELGPLLVALKIVEHLIVSLYVLDQDAEGVLETLIKSYEEFVKVLTGKVSDLTPGIELPLFQILGRNARRFHGYLKTHEAKFLSDIVSGAYTALTVGKMDSFAGSREKHQHFVKPPAAVT
jgi:hypothetical protein